MDILEIIILLAITFGGSIIKFISEKKKVQQDNPDAPKTDDPSFKDILMKEFSSSFDENKDEGAEDDYFENETDDFLPRAESPKPMPTPEPVPATPIVTPNVTPTTTKSVTTDSAVSLHNIITVNKMEDEISDTIAESDLSSNDILDDLNDIDQWKKAVIYQEILQRKG